MNIEAWIKSVLASLLSGGVLFFIVWLRQLIAQKKRNDYETLDLSAKKINLDVHTKPLDDLLSDSNKSHGVTDEVEPTPGKKDSDGSKS